MSERFASSGSPDEQGSVKPSNDAQTVASGETGTDSDRRRLLPTVGEVESGSVSTLLDAWISEYSADLFRFAFRLTGDPANAEDLVQQVFLQAWRNRERLEKVENAKSWLLKITRNQFLKSVRRKRPEAFSYLDLDDQSLVEPTSADESGDVAALLDGLGEEQRLIVLMFYVERLSYREIAKELGVPTGTVMSRLHRAKSRLRVLWERRNSLSSPQERPFD